MFPSQSEEFRSNLFSFFIIRFFFLFALLFTFYLFPVLTERIDPFSFSSKTFLVVSFGFIFLNIWAVIFNRFIPERLLSLFAYTQFFEILFWTMIAYLSGGLKSPYIYVCIITIIYSGILTEERGAIFSVVLAFLMLLGLAVTVRSGSVPLISEELVELYTLDRSSLLATLFLFLFFFSFAGAVSSRIARAIRRMNQALVERERKNREVKRQFYSIFATIPIGVIIVKGGRIVYLNGYARRYEEHLKSLLPISPSERGGGNEWREKRVNGLILNVAVMPHIENQTVLLFSDVTEARKRRR